MAYNKYGYSAGKSTLCQKSVTPINKVLSYHPLDVHEYAVCPFCGQTIEGQWKSVSAGSNRLWLDTITNFTLPSHCDHFESFAGTGREGGVVAYFRGWSDQIVDDEIAS